jgi:hypothetical protein
MHPQPPQNARAADGQSAMCQARPDLAIALAVERRRREHGPDRLEELVIADRRLRSALRPEGGHDGPRRHRHVDSRARHPQDRADHCQRIPVARPGTHGASHRRCLFHSSVSPFYERRCQTPSELGMLAPSRLVRPPVPSILRITLRLAAPLRPAGYLSDPRTPYPFFGTRAGIYPRRR